MAEEVELEPSETLETVDIDNVEIWSTGTFNGDDYSESDLAEMEANYSEMLPKIKPALKLGHSKTQSLIQQDGHPSAGWITNVRKNGHKLLGDLKSVPKKIGQLIQAKAYGRISPEIAWNMRDGEKLRKRVLLGAALLGADIPANGTLQDFINLYQDDDLDVHAYYKLQESTMDEKELQALRERADAAEKRATQAEAELATTKSYSQKLETERKEAENREFSGQVEAVVKEYVGKKLSPAQVPIFKALCFADRAEVKSYSYIENNETRKVEYASTFDLAKKLVDASADLLIGGQTEHQVIERDYAATSEDDKLYAKAKEYQKKNAGVSFKDAMLAVKEG